MRGPRSRCFFEVRFWVQNRLDLALASEWFQRFCSIWILCLYDTTKGCP